MITERVAIRGKTPGSADYFTSADKVVDGMINFLNQGRLEDATDVYMRCQADLGFMLITRAENDQALYKQLANLFFRARDFQKAAMACEELGAYDKAAQFYHQAGDHMLAADMAARIGDHLLAGQMFEQAGQYGHAAELYEQGEAKDRAASCFERSGKLLRAARLYVNIGKEDRALACLQRVPTEGGDALEVSVLVVGILERKGAADLAAAKAIEVISTQRPSTTQPDLWLDLAERLAGYGYLPQAIDGVKKVLDLVIDHPRANELMATLQTRSMETQNAQASPVAAPTAATEGGLTVVSVMQGFDQLKQLALFRDLSLQELRDVHALCSVQRLEAGERLIAQDRPGQALWIVIKGEIEVRKVAGEKVTQLAQLGEGEHVGEMSLVDAAPASAEVIAKGSVDALRLDQEGFSRLLQANNNLANKVYRVFLHELCERLRETSDLAARAGGLGGGPKTEPLIPAQILFEKG